MIDTVNSETDRLLAQGQDAARRGDKAGARSLLTQVVERDPHHELAWMWLSGVVEEPEEQQICLENVLVINPHNDKARRGLDFVSTKTGIPPNMPQGPSEQVALDPEFTTPLTADSPMFAELSGHAGQWGSAPDYAVSHNGHTQGDGANVPGTSIDWMQNIASTSPANEDYTPSSYMPQFEVQDGIGSAISPANPWSEAPQPQPFQQEQLDWSQPDNQFNVMSIADGVDGRLAQFDTLGSGVPPWADPGSSTSDGFADANSPFGVEPFALGAALGTGVGAGVSGSGMGVAGAAPAGMGVMGPMGLHSESQLPSPSELPRFDEPAEQPWYLKSDQLPDQDAGGQYNRAPDDLSDGGKRSLKSKKQDLSATMDCPNCKASVADTSLSCPQCKFSFFVNCPHCHELVDAVDAKAGKTDNCPHCQKSVNRLELGMAGTDSAISYKSTKASPDSMSKEAMEQLEASHKVKRQLSFQWAIDVAWLVVIVAAVWALSQLPTWLRLTGQY